MNFQATFFKYRIALTLIAMASVILACCQASAPSVLASGRSIAAHAVERSAVSTANSAPGALPPLSVQANDLQWVQTPGAPGGPIYALATSGTSLFAGTAGGGVFRSADNGQSWTPANSGLTNAVVTALAVNGTSLFAGTSGGVFRSSDNGQSWTPANNGLTNTSVITLAVSGGSLLAGTNGGGAFRSTDNGQSWAALANNGLTGTIVRSFAIIGTNLFAGTDGEGVFRSGNNGQTWVPVNNGLDSFAKLIYSLGVNGASLFAGTLVGTFRSTDNGQNWVRADNGLVFGIGTGVVFAFAMSGENLFAGTQLGGVFRSTNNGQNWVRASNGLTESTVHTLAVSGANLFAGTDGSVFRSSDNGQSWVSLNYGLVGTSVRALVVSGASLFAGARGGVFRSTDNGQSWVPANNGLLGATVVALAVNGTSLFAGTSGSINSKVFRSTDNGQSWVEANNGLTSALVNAFAVSGTSLFVGTGAGVFRSADNGQSWVPILTNKDVRALAASGANLFAGTFGSGVFRSTDNGQSWMAVNSGLPNSLDIGTLAVSGTNLFAGLTAFSHLGLYRSTDNGQIWTAANNGLPSDTVVSALVTSAAGLFAATAGHALRPEGSGVFRSSDNGQRWVPANNGLTNTAVNALALRGATLFAGTNSGVFVAWTGNIIAGTVRYCISAEPVPSVTLTATTATGAVAASATSGNDGRYELGGLASGFHVATPTKSGEGRGLSAYDAALVAQYVANGGNPPFDNCRLLAADADRNGVVTFSDAQLILRQVVGLMDSGQAGRWRFRPEMRSYTSLTGDQLNQDYDAVLVGDVSGNWTPSGNLAVTAVSLSGATNGRVQDAQWQVYGSGFGLGTTLVLTFPEGGEMRLAASWVEDVTPESFAVRWPIAVPGVWILRVVNSGGEVSQPFAFMVRRGD